MSEKVKDLVEVLPLREYIDFSLLETQKANLLEEYVITKEVEKHLKQILDAILNIKGERKVFFIIGGYGSGKSYFLVFLSLLIDSLLDAEIWKLMQIRLKEEEAIKSRMVALKEKKFRFLPVRIDLKKEAKTESIRGIIISHLKKAAREYLKGRELVLPYEYDVIIEAIREANYEDRERLQKALRKKGLNLDQLIDMLKRREYEGILSYKEAFKEEFRLPPEIPTPSIDEILDQALKELKDDFDGIVFLIDELQKYLEGEPSQKATDDLSTLEAFCEAAATRPVVVIMSVLERELALRIEWGKTYDKLISRFDSLPLTLEGLDKILLSRLKLVKEVEKLLKKSKASKLLSTENFEQLLRIYPINPVTFRLLKKVSELRARDRSAFTFLKWAYPQVMNQPFLMAGDKPSLITPDLLYDYFETDLENIAKEVMDETKSLLLHITEPEIPYLKYMAVASVIEDQFDINDFTQAFLDDKNFVSKQFRSITGKRPEIFPPIKLDEIYAIRPMVGRIANIIEERMKEIKDPLKILIEHLENSTRNICSHKVNGIERGIEIKFSLLEDASQELKKPLLKDTEVKILVVIPRTKLALHDKLVRDLIETSGEANIILALIHEQRVDIETLAKFFAAKMAKDEGKVTKEDVNAIILNIKPHLERLFETGNVTLFFRKTNITKQSNIISFVEDELIVNNDFLNEVLPKTFEKIYPDFSKLRAKIPKDADLSRRTLTNEIISQFFIKESTIGIKPSVVKSVQNIAEPLGFAKKEGNKFVFTVPTQGIKGKIMRIIKEKIKENPNTSSVCNILRNLGFPDCLIDMYLSALILQKEFLISGINFDITNPKDFLGKIKKIVDDSREGIYHNILTVKIIPKEKWSLVKSFLKGISTEQIEITKEGTISGDKIPLALKALRENVTNYKAKLSEFNEYLKEYERKVLRIHKKLRKNEVVSLEIKRTSENLLNYISKMPQVLDQPDPYAGFDQLVELLLELTNKSELYDALYQVEKILEQVGSSIQFMESKEGRELPYEIDYLLDVKVDAYPSLKSKQQEIMALLIENPEAILTSKDNYKSFDSKFKMFKQKYVEAYSEEHNIRNDLVKNFCKDYEAYLPYKLLKALESIKEDLLSISTKNLETKIYFYRKKECDIKNQELQEILKTKVVCDCDYELKGIKEIKEEIQKEQRSMFSEILFQCATALGNLKILLDTNKVQFNDLLRESNLINKGSRLLEEVNNILQNPQKATDKQFQTVLENVESLSDILRKVTKIKVEAPAVIKLSEMLRRFKEEVNKTKATIREMLEWIKRRHREEEEVLIDV